MDFYYLKYGYYNIYIVSCYFIFDELGELFFECIFVFILKGFYVVGNMLVKDVVFVDFSIEFFIFVVIIREFFGIVEESNCLLL